jgi:hypothetical protein
MAKAWTEKSEYRKFSDELVKSQDREFEKLVLSLIRVIWPNAGFRPPEMGWIDRRGIDLLAWSDFQPYPLAVQCKGFKVPEEEIDQSQINQCLKSIASFRDSGIKVETYLLIHNRTGKNEELRTATERALKVLVQSGQAKRAELWDRQKLLSNVFNATVALIRAAVENKRSSAPSYYGDRQISKPLEVVPFTQSELVADPNRLVITSNPIRRLADPVSELLGAEDSNNLLLMIGDAGYGKTTAVLRTFASTSHIVFYIPAATIPNHVNNTTDLLKHCIKVQDLFDTTPNSDEDVFDRLFKTAIRYIFKESDLPITLVIDALDESVYFSRRGGLQSLFNQLREIRCLVILTTRKEFWTQRQQDFSELFGRTGSPEKRRLTHIRLIELLPWGGEQIGELSRKYCNTLVDSTQRKNLEQFINIVDSDEYETYYGDIPRRPLFLRFILETVAERGVRHTGRAKLYYEWAQMKIRRDVCRPMIWGNMGRQPIISETETLDETLRTAFRAMMLAAHQMTNLNGDDIELLPDCYLDNVLLSDEKLRGVVDPTGLFLNSLLVPIIARSHELIRIQFAHRTYQEFFLALYIKENHEQFLSYNLPAPIVELVKDLENEGF